MTLLAPLFLGISLAIVRLRSRHTRLRFGVLCNRCPLFRFFAWHACNRMCYLKAQPLDLAPKVQQCTRPWS